MNNPIAPIGKSYIVGDLHGGFDYFVQLLEAIGFDETCDRIYLCGDIVARGDKSLATLRYVKQLADKGVLWTVLGNHDVTLIATWLDILKPKSKDKTLEILQAPDCDELLDWLRRQPFLLDIGVLIVHAGIPPIWDTQMAKRHSAALGSVFAGDVVKLRQILPHLYDKKPCVFGAWDNDDVDYLRKICDYLTRMRLCDEQGCLDLKFKGSHQEDLPEGFRPWFEWQPMVDKRIFFGHWAALEGKISTKTVRSLDGGCVWGGHLMAYCLQDDAVICVACG